MPDARGVAAAHVERERLEEARRVVLLEPARRDLGHRHVRLARAHERLARVHDAHAPPAQTDGRRLRLVNRLPERHARRPAEPEPARLGALPVAARHGHGGLHEEEGQEAESEGSHCGLVGVGGWGREGVSGEVLRKMVDGRSVDRREGPVTEIGLYRPRMSADEGEKRKQGAPSVDRLRVVARGIRCMGALNDGG